MTKLEIKKFYTCTSDRDVFLLHFIRNFIRSYFEKISFETGFNTVCFNISYLI